MTYYNPANANAQVRDLAGVDCSATVTNWVSDRVFSVNYTGNAATAANNLLALNWVADSRF